MPAEMRCHECGRNIEHGVKLSDYVTVCETCYVEMMAAWRAENAGRPSQSCSCCPPPMELYERIAAVRRAIGDQPRRVPMDYVPRDTMLYVPKRVAYRSARRGTETRE